MKRNLYINQRTGSSTAHVLYFPYIRWRASEPEFLFRTRVKNYRSNLKPFTEVRNCLVRISSNNVRFRRDVKFLKIIEGTRGRVRFEMWKLLQNSWTGSNSLLNDNRIDKTTTCTLKERWSMNCLLRIWEWEGAARSLFRAVPLMNQIEKCIFKTREDFNHNSQTKPQFVSYIITGDGYWKCQYDPQTNLEIMDCRIIASKKTKNSSEKV
jgi:hypothetical protein